jgi:hypothetical protein
MEQKELQSDLSTADRLTGGTQLYRLSEAGDAQPDLGNLHRTSWEPQQINGAPHSDFVTSG